MANLSISEETGACEEGFAEVAQQSLEIDISKYSRFATILPTPDSEPEVKQKPKTKYLPYVVAIIILLMGIALLLI